MKNSILFLSSFTAINGFTTIFELELANAYMKIKLEDYKPGEVNKWKIFKKEFIKEMDEWNIEFADFTSII